MSKGDAFGPSPRERSPDGSPPSASVSIAVDHDPYWDYDDEECANCGGEGFTYGCSWDWQCDTYDESEGTCLCTRPCDWCRPRKPNPELQKVLAEALAAQGTSASGQDPKGLEAKPAGPVAASDAPKDSRHD